MNHTIVQTRQDTPGERWQPVTSASTTSAPAAGADNAVHLTLGEALRPDTFRGFGGAFTESAAFVYSALSEEEKERVLQLCFSPDTGLGYTFARTHMNSCDFSLGNYSAVETPGDTKLWSFVCEQEPKYLWPFMRDAQRYLGAEIPLLLSPWSPPAWMKSNGSMNNGGTLRPEYRDAWARYFCRYIAELRSQGFDVFGITVQNEPEATQTWDSCRYTAAEEAGFIRDYLGPELHKQGLADVALYCWDHNRDLLQERVDAIMQDSGAAQYVAGAAIHWYSEGQFDQVEAVKAAYPDLEIIFSEGCIENGVKLGAWDRAERYARNIIGDLNAGVTLWLDWNMMLDMQGGPNHVGNYCDAPLIADTERDAVHLQPSYSAIGHFSRYIQPGALCLSLTTDTTDTTEIDVTSFANPDGSTVTVVCNSSDTDRTLHLHAGTSSTPITTTIPKHSVTTCVTES